MSCLLLPLHPLSSRDACLELHPKCALLGLCNVSVITHGTQKDCWMQKFSFQFLNFLEGRDGRREQWLGSKLKALFPVWPWICFWHLAKIFHLLDSSQTAKVRKIAVFPPFIKVLWIQDRINKIYAFLFFSPRESVSATANKSFSRMITKMVFGNGMFLTLSLSQTLSSNTSSIAIDGHKNYLYVAVALQKYITEIEPSYFLALRGSLSRSPDTFLDWLAAWHSLP